MAKTIMELFKERKKEVYTSPGPLGGISGLTIIESRGIINPPRQAALLLASPNAVADLIGSAGGALLGGNANRPSDTIFKNNNVFTKPISVVPTVSQLRNAIDPKETYFVKTEPSPGANIANFIKNAVQSPAAAQTAALQLITKLGSKGALKDAKNYFSALKDAKPEENYGPKFHPDKNNKTQTGDARYYSTHYTIYGKQDNRYSRKNSRNEYVRAGIKERPTNLKNWDIINDDVLKTGQNNKDEFIYDSDVKTLEESNSGLNQTYVKFTLYKKTNANIILPGTISGISEDFAPEWSSFKYIGSPFNLYRYGGVERTLKFDVKMYYLDLPTKTAMINNLNRLRKLVFPDEEIGVSTYPLKPGDNDTATSQLFFRPNLVYLTINGLYENILGIVDSLSFSIDDNVSWATTADDMGVANDTKLYPTVINVSLGMKIIEHPAIKTTTKQVDGKDVKTYTFEYGESKEKDNQYVNYFTGVKH